MTPDPDRSSRRDFVLDVGRIASAVAVTACVTAQPAQASALPRTPPRSGSDWDLSWLERLAGATDRAVFDWADPGDPGDPAVLEIAERYLDGCAAAYGAHPYQARVVLNIRHGAVPAALTDAAWERFALGAESDVKDPGTDKPAVRNPFWRRAASVPAGSSATALPTIEGLVQRGATCSSATSR